MIFCKEQEMPERGTFSSPLCIMIMRRKMPLWQIAREDRERLVQRAERRELCVVS